LGFVFNPLIAAEWGPPIYDSVGQCLLPIGCAWWCHRITYLPRLKAALQQLLFVEHHRSPLLGRRSPTRSLAVAAAARHRLECHREAVDGRSRELQPPSPPLLAPSPSQATGAMRHHSADRLPRAVPALSVSSRPGCSSFLTSPSPSPSVRIGRRQADVALLCTRPRR
jgi:hypothetical protein